MAAASANLSEVIRSQRLEEPETISACDHCKTIRWHHQSCAAFHDDLNKTESICTCGGKQVIHHALCNRPREVEAESEEFDMESSFRKLPRLSRDVRKALEPLAAWLDECEENFDPRTDNGAWFDDMQEAVRAYITNKNWRPMD